MTTGGRIGQYVEDKDGKKLSLTGLIFGKHHDLFDYCSQLQVSQKNRGEIIIYYVPIRELPSNIPPSQLFDSAGLKLDISFKKIDQPIKTTSGKVLLLVDEL
jgi:phenylacetate-CoA ligase